MTVYSSLPHTFLVTNFSTVFQFEESAHGLEQSTVHTENVIERLGEVIPIGRIFRKTRRRGNV